MADLHALKTKPNAETEEILGHLREHAEKHAAEFSADVVGYVLVTWGRDGKWYVSSKRGSTSPFPRTLIPAFVEECVRTTIITSNEIEEAKSQ